MIRAKITYHSFHCQSEDSVKNGHTPKGKPQYRCKNWGRGGGLNPTVPYTEAEKERIIHAYYERPSMCGIECVFGVTRPTLADWLKKAAGAPTIPETLAPARPRDTLELDELWSFVYRCANKRGRWTARCRRTRQIVAFVIGDRSEQTCRRLGQRIPETDTRGHSFSDFWDAYARVFPKETHRCVGKGTGETDHRERWNNTVRQSNVRDVRKTLESVLKFNRWLETASTPSEIALRRLILNRRRSVLP